MPLVFFAVVLGFGLGTSIVSDWRWIQEYNWRQFWDSCILIASINSLRSLFPCPQLPHGPCIPCHQIIRSLKLHSPTFNDPQHYARTMIPHHWPRQLTMKWYYQDGAVTKPPGTLFGYRRRNVLLLSLLAGICILALTLGLAIGLTRRSQAYPLNPLPYNLLCSQSLFLGQLYFWTALMCLEGEGRIYRCREIRGGFSRGIWHIMLLV